MSTLQDKLDLAEDICTLLSPQEWAEMASILFDQVETIYEPEDVAVIKDQLGLAGVDTDGICRKKHPPAPQP